jgi:hypothetical protein
MNIPRKWIIIGAVAIAAIIFGKYNEANSKKTIQATETAQKVDTLTYAQKFDKKQFNELSGVYKPVRDYLKKNLNDPSSLEIANTWNLGMNKDSSFAIKTTFRAKNEYNALVLQAIYCNVSFDGAVSDVKIE